MSSFWAVAGEPRSGAVPGEIRPKTVQSAVSRTFFVRPAESDKVFSISWSLPNGNQEEVVRARGDFLE